MSDTAKKAQEETELAVSFIVNSVRFGFFLLFTGTFVLSKDKANLLSHLLLLNCIIHSVKI